MLKSRSFIAAIAAGAIVVAGCSAGSTDYKKAAEKAFTDASGDGSKATCDKPESTDVGTTFACVGTAADGTVFNLVATIDKKNHVIVNSDPSADTGTVTEETTSIDDTLVDDTVLDDETLVTTGS